METAFSPALLLRRSVVRPVGSDVQMQRPKRADGLVPITSVNTRIAECTPIVGAHIKTTSIRGLVVRHQRLNTE